MKAIARFIGRALQAWGERPVLFQAQLADSFGNVFVAHRIFRPFPHDKGEKLAWLSDLTGPGLSMRDIVAKGEKAWIRGYEKSAEPIMVIR